MVVADVNRKAGQASRPRAKAASAALDLFATRLLGDDPSSEHETSYRTVSLDHPISKIDGDEITLGETIAADATGWFDHSDDHGERDRDRYWYVGDPADFVIDEEARGAYSLG